MEKIGHEHGRLLLFIPQKKKEKRQEDGSDSTVMSTRV